MKSILSKLAKPFPESEISWRVGATNSDKTKGIALAYIDARNVMDRLDSVVGAENWQAEYPFPGCCRIGIFLNGQWVWKSNGAGETDVEGEKGQYSDAYKRAAVLWGIGRYLYALPNSWVELESVGKSHKIKNTPKLPKWALPGSHLSQDVVRDFVDQMTEALSKSDEHYVQQLWSEHTDADDKTFLWSHFSSQQRKFMKDIMKGE